MTALFDYSAPDYGVDEAALWQLRRYTDDAGNIVQSRATRTRPRWRVALQWARNPTVLAAFQTALNGLAGGFVEVYFYTGSLWLQWDDVSAGTGDGANLLFPFPGREVYTDSEVVKVDGVTKTRVTHYNLDYDGGDSLKRERIHFTAGNAPANGKAVTISFLGRRLLIGRMASDVSIRTISYQRSEFAITLEGEEA